MSHVCPHNVSNVTGAAASGGADGKKTFFTVYVGEDIYGLDVTEAQAIFRVGAITPIPLMKKEIAGLINLRGRVVVAVRLRQRLGAAPGNAPESIAIGFERAGERFALLADRVGDVLALPDSARTALPPHFDAAQSRYMRELYKCCVGLIPILDVERLLDFE